MSSIASMETVSQSDWSNLCDLDENSNSTPPESVPVLSPSDIPQNEIIERNYPRRGRRCTRDSNAKQRQRRQRFTSELIKLKNRQHHLRGRALTHTEVIISTNAYIAALEGALCELLGAIRCEKQLIMPSL